MSRPPTLANPTALQRFEGSLILAGSIWVFAETGRSWWLFALLLLVPDVSMVGYLRDARLGAAIYNLGHILLGPAVLLAWGVARARILLPFWISPPRSGQRSGGVARQGRGGAVRRTARDTRWFPGSLRSRPLPPFGRTPPFRFRFTGEKSWSFRGGEDLGLRVMGEKSWGH